MHEPWCLAVDALDVVAPVGSQHRENVGPGESATETRRIDEREESQ